MVADVVLLAALVGLMTAGVGAAATHAASPPGFVSAWLSAVEEHRAIPVGVQLCAMAPAQHIPPGFSNCSLAGKWTYRKDPYVYTIVEAADKTFTIASNASTDPWHKATGEFLRHNSSTPLPARCLGGMVTRRHLETSRLWDIDIHFDCDKKGTPRIISHKGRFSADCNALTMDDGGTYQRVGTTNNVSEQQAATSEEQASCRVAPLTPVTGGSGSVWSLSAKLGWKETTVSYELADKSLRFDVTISTTSTNDASDVVRIQSNVTALTTLTSCVGGLALLNLTLVHNEPTVLYGSTGGPKGAATALQPWQCPLDSSSSPNSLNMTCRHLAGTPFRAGCPPA